MLQELRQAHAGIDCMKGLARALMWWPSMDAEIETTVKQFGVCVMQLL
jgi:hypothetical protein